jgi:hypothetical protein
LSGLPVAAGPWLADGWALWEGFPGSDGFAARAAAVGSATHIARAKPSWMIRRRISSFPLLWKRPLRTAVQGAIDVVASATLGAAER